MNLTTEDYSAHEHNWKLKRDENQKLKPRAMRTMFVWEQCAYVLLFVSLAEQSGTWSSFHAACGYEHLRTTVDDVVLWVLPLSQRLRSAGAALQRLHSFIERRSVSTCRQSCFRLNMLLRFISLTDTVELLRSCCCWKSPHFSWKSPHFMVFRNSETVESKALELA